VRRLLPLSSAVAGLCIVLALIPDQWAEVFAFDRKAILNGEVWRLWTGHLVHFSTLHTVFDVLTLFFASQIFEADSGSQRLFSVLVTGAFFISCGMLLWVPDMVMYRGASGISATILVLATESLCRNSRRLQILLAVLGALLLSKIWIDATGVIQIASSLPDGVHLAWQTHLLGVVAGASMVAYFAFKHRSVEYGFKGDAFVHSSVDLDSNFVARSK